MHGQTEQYMLMALMQLLLIYHGNRDKIVASIISPGGSPVNVRDAALYPAREVRSSLPETIWAVEASMLERNEGTHCTYSLSLLVETGQVEKVPSYT